MSLNQTHNYLCQQGSSNKFYTLMLNSTSGGWVVLSHYGRAGTAGTQRVVKSQSSYFAALEAFEAACKKRLARGYVLVGTATDAPAQKIQLKSEMAAADQAARQQRLDQLKALPVRAVEIDPMRLWL